MNYLIWSYRHREWWQANRSGYSRMIERAGQYTEADAAQIVLGGLPGANTAVDVRLAARFGGDADEVESALEEIRRI